MPEAKSNRQPTQWPTVAAAVMALAIFALDILSPLQGAVAVLYTAVVVMVARCHSRYLIIGTGLVCGWLTIICTRGLIGMSPLRHRADTRRTRIAPMMTLRGDALTESSSSG